MLTPEKLCEIDHKVAEAIGGEIVDYHWRFSGSLFMPTVSTAESHNPLFADEVRDVWMPSTDLNHAFYAAEAAGLFVEYGWSLYFNGAQWEIVKEHPQGETLWGLGKTKTLAICNAILLKAGK